MIHDAVFPVEPWRVCEAFLDLDLLAQTESVFAVANGHIGLRGNLDEGDPHVIAGTYLNSYYEQRPLPYPEGGYGYPEQGQTVVNVTDGKLIRLMVDDEPFHVAHGRLLAHERVLDLRTGQLRRAVDWESPARRRVRIRSSRLVSFTQRAVAAVDFEVEAVDREVRITVQSGLVANEQQPQRSADPRVAAALDHPLVAVAQDTEQHGAVLLHRTRASGLLMGAGMDHAVEATGGYDEETDVRDDWARTTVVTVLQPGERLRITKFLGYAWSSSRSPEALRDQVAGVLTGARYAGWDGLAAEQRAYLDEFWDAADVEIDGDPVLQQAVRFGLFHVLQAGYAWEAALVDLRDLHHNTRDGLHMASLAGAWSAIVEGFGGLREEGSMPALAPRLPAGITGLRFRLRHSGLRLLVEADHTTVRVSLRDGADARLAIRLYDETVEVTAGEVVERSVAALQPLLPQPAQPPGYAPQPAAQLARAAAATPPDSVFPGSGTSQGH
jgi:alpha,alpha-trehalose phosphorylase